MVKSDRRMSDTRGGTTVTIDKLSRRNGVAGQIVVTVKCHWTFDDATTEHDVFQLSGSAFGGPVVYVHGNVQAFVANHERFGRFESDPIEWARRFTLNED